MTTRQPVGRYRMILPLETDVIMFTPGSDRHGETTLVYAAGRSGDGTLIPSQDVIGTYATSRMAGEAALQLAAERGYKISVPAMDVVPFVKHGTPGSPLEKPSQLVRALFAHTADESDTYEAYVQSLS